MTRFSRYGLVCLLASCLLAVRASTAHDGHAAATYEVTKDAGDLEQGTHLRLRVVEAAGRDIAARFSLTIDGREYVPPQLGIHGLRFTSIHERKQNRFTATYARGSGEVLVPMPDGTARGTVTAAKGFEYVSDPVDFVVEHGRATARIVLRRWIDLQSEGWHAADEHLHFERTNRAHDLDWLTMLDADGLSHAHFLVLKGGNLPGVWAEQYAYGVAGRAQQGQQLIIPGEEYRDTEQGHINLLGIDEVIQPISTGGLGEPRVDFNYPPLVDVFRKAHSLGGIGGPAHGASFSENSTALLATILGDVDFFEIANSHLFKTDVWYQLLNCGFIVPPVAGTDLPNFGFRDDWQPLLGEVRTYVHIDSQTDASAWKDGLVRGESFVTSGPIIRLDVCGVGPGGTLYLPAEGGKVSIECEIASPRPLEALNLVQMGQVLDIATENGDGDGIYRLRLRYPLEVTKSCWVAARGIGQPKHAIEKGLAIKQSEMAHTAVVQIIVGQTPIRSESAVEAVRAQLVRQQVFYSTRGKYERAEHRLHFLQLFDEAIDKLGLR